MNMRCIRALLAALIAASTTAAHAHEVECRLGAGVVRVDGNGRPILDANRLPAFLAPPSPVFVVDSYPATVGVQLWIHNLAADSSVLTGVSSSLLTGTTGVLSYGDAIQAGVSLPVGATATGALIVTLRNQEQCVAVLGGAPAAPQCSEFRDQTLTLTHDAGSAECRARIICAPARATTCGDGTCNGTETCTTCSADCNACPPPPPPPACGDGTCNGTETCTTCSADCGACPPSPPPPACGDGTCNGTETCTTCPADCGACSSTTYSCAATFTYPCLSGICAICDQISGSPSEAELTALRSYCGLVAGELVADRCPSSASDLPAHCSYVTTTTTTLKNRYYNSDWAPSDAQRDCIDSRGVWVP